MLEVIEQGERRPECTAAIRPWLSPNARASGKVGDHAIARAQFERVHERPRYVEQSRACCGTPVAAGPSIPT